MFLGTSNHRIYFKHYVYPRAKSKFVAPIIISSVGSSIKVDDASVFRVGYQLIFGTGSDRNVLTVTAINKRTNMLYVCGWILKEDFFKKAEKFEKGKKRKRKDGSKMKLKANNFEIKISELNDFSDLLNEYVVNRTFKW